MGTTSHSFCSEREEAYPANRIAGFVWVKALQNQILVCRLDEQLYTVPTATREIEPELPSGRTRRRHRTACLRSALLPLSRYIGPRLIGIVIQRLCPQEAIAPLPPKTLSSDTRRSPHIQDRWIDVLREPPFLACDEVLEAVHQRLSVAVHALLAGNPCSEPSLRVSP